jgi:lipoic acid synthetase
VRRRTPSVTIEVLTPDFQGEPAAIERVARSGAEVLGHNVETVQRLSGEVRDRRCGYALTLEVLVRYRSACTAAVVKSSLLLGLGERPDEVRATLGDLRRAGVDWVTLGQYLRPSRKHAPVRHFVPPDRFDRYAEEARELGFPLVSAGPLVRSSYRAAESQAAALYRSRVDAS